MYGYGNEEPLKKRVYVSHADIGCAGLDQVGNDFWNKPLLLHKRIQ